MIGDFMKYLVYLPLFFLLVGCSPSKQIDNWLQVDIYTTGSTTEDALVETISAPNLINLYQKALTTPLKKSNLFSPDLSYKLSVQTNTRTIEYTLMFDLKNKLALAKDLSGTYDVPFDWVIKYLNKVPLEEHFTYLLPPKFQVAVNQDTLSLGVQQDWSIVPVEGVSYPHTYEMTTYETYHSPKIPLTLSGEFSHFSPDQITLRRTTNGKEEIFQNPSLDALPIPETPGHYLYQLEAVWHTANKGYLGHITYTFAIDIPFPTDYLLNHTTYEPGDCLVMLITHTNDLDYQVKTEPYSKTIGLFYYGKDNQHLIGFIPLDSRITPGDYTLNIYRNQGNLLVESIPYTVVPKEFETQQLSISGTTASLKSQENRKNDQAKFAKAKSHSAGQQLWDGAFILPVEGRVSTEYATIRYVNEGVESSRHNALDLAAPTGTPVKASNTGVVTFASDLIISGNVVVIDHGYGLFTTYVHLDKIHVEEGETVSKGDIIGEVGTTGYSTGPHLHWSLWKNGVFLNPWKFIEEDPVSAFKDKE